MIHGFIIKLRTLCSSDRWNVLQEDMYNFSTEDFLKSQNFTLDFELLQSLSLEFPLLAHIKKIEDTRCSLFIVRVRILLFQFRCN